MATVPLDGLGIPESPRWHDGRLWFCNWTTPEIVAVDAGGMPEVVATVDATVPYSIDWLPDGTLLVVAGRQAQLRRQGPSGELLPHVDLSAYGGTFNEIVVDGEGNAFVNFDGILVVRANSSTELVAQDLRWGNGMATTPDGSTLVVTKSHGPA